MRPVWIISLNTFREIIRDRILYGLIVFALLLIGLSLVLGQLSFAEQLKISTDFGFAAIHLGAVILSIFVGSTLVSKEIDKKTVMTLLARPITRFQFLLGKAVGLMMVIITVILGLSLVLAVIFYSLGVRVTFPFLIGLYGVVLESMVLLCLALFFSTFTRPVMVVSSTLGLFLIGHWTDSLSYFAQQGQSKTIVVVEKLINVFLPNLESFNWRSLVVYGETASINLIVSSSIYAFIWVMLTLLSATLIIWRKDFG